MVDYSPYVDEQNSMNRWYKYYKTIGLSHEQMMKMGLTKVSEIGQGGKPTLSFRDAMKSVQKDQ